MNRTSFEAQLAVNFVAVEIRHNGVNFGERKKHLKAVFAHEDFTLAELTEVLDPNWKSVEQVLAEEAAKQEADEQDKKKGRTASNETSGAMGRRKHCFSVSAIPITEHNQPIEDYQEIRP